MIEKDIVYFTVGVWEEIMKTQWKGERTKLRSTVKQGGGDITYSLSTEENVKADSYCTNNERTSEEGFMARADRMTYLSVVKITTRPSL